MKYFIDTEFLEGTQAKKVLGFNVGQTKPTIDLISIGIVAEDGREYYAISKEFNLKEAWNRFQWKFEDIHPVKFRQKGMSETYGNMAYPKTEYWLRENVFRPIFNELKCSLECTFNVQFNYETLKRLIELRGKTNAQIAEEVKEFVYNKEDILYNHEDCSTEHIGDIRSAIEFYGYYADYDWVVFCWLFGKMIDLPQGFPMYCNDLKQILETRGFACNGTTIPLEMWGKDITEHPNYPAQKDEHNALADARWNKKLYEFLKSL